MTTISVTSDSVKTFQESLIFDIYNIIILLRTNFLSDSILKDSIIRTNFK